MYQLLIIYVFLCSFGIINSEPPPFITKCSKTSPDFQKCCTEVANKAFPFLIKGDKSLKIPNMTPLKLDKVDVETGSNLKMQFTNFEFHGLDTCKIPSMVLDDTKLTMEMECDQVRQYGNYAIDGKIMILPLKGNGINNFTYEHPKLKYVMPLEKVKRNGIDYLSPKGNDDVTFEIEDAHFQLDNLFNGNKQMGDNVNKFLNDNSKAVIKEMGGAISNVVRSIAQMTARSLFAAIPYDELVLP